MNGFIHCPLNKSRVAQKVTTFSFSVGSRPPHIQYFVRFLPSSSSFPLFHFLPPASSFLGIERGGYRSIRKTCFKQVICILGFSYYTCTRAFEFDLGKSGSTVIQKPNLTPILPSFLPSFFPALIWQSALYAFLTITERAREAAAAGEAISAPRSLGRWLAPPDCQTAQPASPDKVVV